MTTYRVRAALATVRTATVHNPRSQGGFTAVHLPQGAILPPDVPAVQIQHLLDAQIIEPVDAPTAQA